MKLWTTTRRVKHGRVLSWRAGKKLWMQVFVQDGTTLDLDYRHSIQVGDTRAYAYIGGGYPMWVEEGHE